MYVNDKDVTSKVTVTNNDDGFVVDFPKQFIYDNQGQAVRLEYSGTLNDKAVVNSTAGNKNKVELVYTNNPNKENDYDTRRAFSTAYFSGRISAISGCPRRSSNITRRCA